MHRNDVFSTFGESWCRFHASSQNDSLMQIIRRYFLSSLHESLCFHLDFWKLFSSIQTCYYYARLDYYWRHFIAYLSFVAYYEILRHAGEKIFYASSDEKRLERNLFCAEVYIPEFFPLSSVSFITFLSSAESYILFFPKKKICCQNKKNGYFFVYCFTIAYLIINIRANPYGMKVVEILSTVFL